MNNMMNQPSRTVEELITALRSHTYMKSVEPLISELAQVGAPAVGPLITALAQTWAPSIVSLSAANEEENEFNRWAIVKALDRIGQALMQAGDRGALDALVTIGQALMRASAPGAVDALAFVVAYEKTPMDIGEKAAVTLMEIGGPRAVGALVAAIEHHETHNDHIFKALLQIGAPAVEPLIAALEAEKWEYLNPYLDTAWVLGRLGDVRAFEPILRTCFHHVNMGSRSYTREALTALARFSNLDYRLEQLAQVASRVDQLEDSNDVYDDYEPSEKAICSLCELNSPLTSNILHLVTQKGMIKGRSQVDLSLKRQRDLARAELTRRGNPPYRPELFLKHVEDGHL